MANAFMNQDFLLRGPTARRLYHQVAAKMPIIDYHCHIEARDIFEDRVYPDLAALWLGGDHYKWRALRACGVPERYITGDASPYEKFERWAAVLPRLIGNPLYHWTHLELQRYFDIHEPLGPDSCAGIWEKAGQRLPALSARQIIVRSRVQVICTTDDPVDDLAWHQRLARDGSMTVRVLPTFRPDRALNIDKPGFLDYIRQLAQASGTRIADLDSLEGALARRLDAFMALGCRLSDHGLGRLPGAISQAPEAALQKALAGQPLSPQEADSYRAELLCRLAGLYRARGLAMQLHYGALRDVNPQAFAALGPDSGFDAIWGCADSGRDLAALLGLMQARGGLPRTIVYSLNPNDNAQITTVLGGFQDGETPGKMQHGSAWWFNDTRLGMAQQLRNLADTGVLGTFIGMLTDSRSLLSYTRHEYFRRVLCDLLGDWVERGEYPQDEQALTQLVKDICYNNAVSYLNLA
ncbi:MAG: glucuronate isomerase [Clostridiales bacterium]|nr:glucuronate isomerase [Clostridiales bacterium]